jgi:hypothetical protein
MRDMFVGVVSSQIVYLTESIVAHALRIPYFDWMCQGCSGAFLVGTLKTVPLAQVMLYALTRLADGAVVTVAATG